MQNLLVQIWTVWSQMAPWLLFGFAVAGILYVSVKPSFIKKHFAENKLSSIVKTALLGVPLPLCSCGTIPVAASLRNQGASKGATAAFLLSTPQTGVDSIAVTYSLMGLFFAVFRPVTALLTGIAGGIIVNVFDRDPPELKRLETPAPAGPDKHAGDMTGNTSNAESFGKTIKQICHYSFYLLPKDIGKAIALGVIIAGLIGVFVSPEMVENIPGGTFVQMLFMMLVGIPVYVCATSSVPVAAALIAKGVSPGAALVFLVTGPATNAAAISTIWKIMGRKTAVIYLVVTAVFALLAGLIADRLIDADIGHVPQIIDEAHPEIWQNIFGVILLLVILNAFIAPKIKKRIYAKR